MVQFTLPKNSKVKKGKAWNPPPEGTRRPGAGASTASTASIPRPSDNPRVDTYWVDMNECGPMVLDALLWIKNTIDPTLTFRRSCREGVCGSCSMNIAGTNTLACTMHAERRQGRDRHLSAAAYAGDQGSGAGHDAVLRPASRHRAVAQDRLARRRKRNGARATRTAHKLDGLYECILCACCSTACPSYWWNSDRYLGPAILLQADRWVEDSRDERTGERLDDLEDPFRLYRCHTILNCTKACPKGLNPAAAISSLKRKMVERAE